MSRARVGPIAPGCYEWLCSSCKYHERRMMRSGSHTAVGPPAEYWHYCTYFDDERDNLLGVAGRFIGTSGNVPQWCPVRTGEIKSQED